MKQFKESRTAPRFVGAALLATALFTTAACGGGDSTGSSSADATTVSVSASAITKSQLIKRADRICARTDEVQRKKFNAYSKKHEVVLQDNPEMRKVMKTILLPPVSTEIAEIAALGAPIGDVEKVNTIITGWDGALKASLANPSLVLGVGEGPFTRPNNLAGKYGFKVCDNIA